MDLYQYFLVMSEGTELPDLITQVKKVELQEEEDIQNGGISARREKDEGKENLTSPLY